MPALALSVLVGTLAGLWIPAPAALLPAGLFLLLAPPFWWLGGRLPVAVLTGFVCAQLSSHNYQDLALSEAGSPVDTVVIGLVSSFPRPTSRGQDFTFERDGVTYNQTR